MYSLVMMAAMTASPELPQEFLCPVSPSNYGSSLWLKKCFYDCCLPARYGWVNCWNKGFGYYPGTARGFCGSCATASYGQFYTPSACSTCGYGSGMGGMGCSMGGCGIGGGKCGFGGFCCLKMHGLNDWGIGCKPAYWTSVTGCPPAVTCPPYAYYTNRQPCASFGHFAFDSGLLGHSYGVGYAGFSGYGNFGFYGAGPMQHPPTVADIPKYQPQDFMHYEARPYVSGREYVAPGYVPPPVTNAPAAPQYNEPRNPEFPRAVESPMPPMPPVPSIPSIPSATPMLPIEKMPTEKLPPPVNPGLFPEIPKSLVPMPPLPGEPLPKEAPKKESNKVLSVQPVSSTVVLTVPAGAKVFVEGVPLKSNTIERTFRTPALAPGQEYAYTVTAIVEQDGREYTESKKVIVIPGEMSKASFNQLLARFGTQSNIVQTSGK